MEKVMLMSLENMVIQLVEGKRLAFRGARDVHLECTEGLLWLTVEGQPDDFLLARGERLCIGGNGLAIIQGMPSASIRLAYMASESIRQGRRLAWRFNPCAVHIVA
jgi:hypothetical protein